jgi:hypothetical protein
VKALLRPLVSSSSWAQQGTVLASTTFKGAAQSSDKWVGLGTSSHCDGGHDSCVRFSYHCSFFGVGSASHCCSGHDMCGCCSRLCSIGRLEDIQPMCWWARRVRALVLPVFVSSSWAQPATMLAGTTCECAALASVHLVDMGSGSSASHCVGGHNRCGRYTEHCSLGRSGRSQPLCRRARQVMKYLCYLRVGSACHICGRYD